MLVSIRKFLLVNLLVSIIITTCVTTIANYILNQKDIEYHLDALLSQSALAFISLITDQHEPHELMTIQKQLNLIPSVANGYNQKFYNPYSYSYEDKFQFQLWDSNKKLILHSFNAPHKAFNLKMKGFSNQEINGQIWRVFTVNSSSQNLTLAMAERYDVRAELGNRMARDDLYIMLLIYPLLGLNIWLIIGKGLDALKRVANEVSHRDPHYLKPVDLAEIPIEIKPLIDELNDLFLRLDKALDREKRFAADAAHELRTPLAALKTQAQLALKVQEPEQKLAIIQKIIMGVDRSTHVVQQLLALSRVSAEEATAIKNMQVVDFHKIVIDEVGLQVGLAIEKDIELSLLAEDRPYMILGNLVALGILVRNLVDNAIRYTQVGGQVTVDLREDKTYLYFKITDNGPGIPPELYKRVFQRFYRVLGTQQQGSGLGLAIIEEILNNHHAIITLNKPSGFDQGLEVEVRFNKTYTEP